MEDAVTITVHTTKIDTSCTVCVPEEPNSVPRGLENAIRRGLPHQVLARGAEHVMDPFQGQSCVYVEKLKPRNTGYAPYFYGSILLRSV
jgi:hypothetical protein